MSGQRRVEDDLALGVQLVSDPPHPHGTDIRHSLGVAQRALRLLDHRRIDGVHQPPVHLAGRVLEDDEDGDGDREADRPGRPTTTRRRHPRR